MAVALEVEHEDPSKVERAQGARLATLGQRQATRRRSGGRRLRDLDRPVLGVETLEPINEHAKRLEQTLALLALGQVHDGVQPQRAPPRRPCVIPRAHLQSNGAAAASFTPAQEHASLVMRHRMLEDELTEERFADAKIERV